MPGTVKFNATSLPDVVDSLIREAQGDIPFDRRHQMRQPFLCAATVVVDIGKPWRTFAFVRDISEHGIGLRHSVPLELVDVTMEINRENKEPIRLRAKMQWCDPCRDGWYVSGGLLLGVVGGNK